MNTLENTRPKALFKDINMYNICLLSFMCTVGSVLSPAYPAMTEHFNITPDQMGLYVSVTSASVLLASPIIGVLADRIGRKKVLSVSLIMFMAFGLLCGVSSSYLMLLVFAFFSDFGMPAFRTLPTVLAGDLYQGSQRVQAMGIVNASAQAALAVFPLLGGALVAISWNAPFLVYFAALPAIIATFFFFKEPKIAKSQESLGNYLKTAVLCYSNKKVLALAVISISIYFVLSGCYIVYMPFLVQEATGSAAMIGLTLSVQALVSCAAGFTLGPLSKKFSLETLIKLSFLLVAISFAFAIQSNTPDDLVLLFLSNAIFGIALGIAIPAFFTLYVNNTPEEVRGIFLSIVAFVNRFGNVAGPIVFGLVYVQWGIDGVFISGALVCLLGFLFSVLFLKNSKISEC